MEGAFLRRENNTNRESIIERVDSHIREFDAQIEQDQLYPPKEVEDAWQEQEWHLGDDATVHAIGVMHTPETLLTHRQNIERAIKESDVVINEFAPEAIGMYDQSRAPELRRIPSRLDPDFNLEELREEFVRDERAYNIGPFHHEIELMAAKHAKDMACIDLTYTKDPENLLQEGSYLIEGAYDIKRDSALNVKGGLAAGSVAAAIASAVAFHSALEKKMTRRRFLTGSLAVAAGATMAGASLLTPVPDRALVREAEGKDSDEALTTGEMHEKLRNVNIALGLKRLVNEKGYKKVVLIYGSRHLDQVRKLLEPEGLPHLSAEEQAILDSEKAFRIYRLASGKNTSEKFAASPDQVWKRVE